MTLTSRLVPEAYRATLGVPAFRRLLSALVGSHLGDGMSVVAIAWLALRLAPPERAGLLIGAAVAAYTLPAAAGALLLARWLSRVPAHRLVIANAGLRAGALGAIVVLHLLGQLTAGRYIALLAGSSLLTAWGSAGTYTLISRMFPADRRLPANALVGTSQQAAFVVGPALAGLLVAGVHPAVVLGVDALTYLLLAVQASRLDLPAVTAAPDGDGRPTGTGIRLLLRRPELVGLVGVTAVFYFLYGPVEVALPLYVADELNSAARLLGAYWTVFGIGAVVGGLLGGTFTAARQWPVTIAVIAGWGLSLLPFGLSAPVWLTLCCFAVGGLVYGPFPAFSLALFQNAAEPADLPAVLAARSAVTTAAMPLGAALGGPLATALGAGGTLLGSGVATVGLAALTAGTLLIHARTRRPITARRRLGVEPR
ncbi:MFS transporter [Plantactinospora sp. S1510]|uniref:MFS transporter n=1 Tax=Plantactinospora alkalitolerans TaxID=2789879 RepID=A0ABS0H1E7_9ACTN|nr:MFS transporter [Plantactinospora alkalitolerans]MBF9132270.1 MFS transporter [Plantactinospora alkalitolerans]